MTAQCSLASLPTPSSIGPKWAVNVHKQYAGGMAKAGMGMLLLRVSGNVHEQCADETQEAVHQLEGPA